MTLKLPRTDMGKNTSCYKRECLLVVGRGYKVVGRGSWVPSHTVLELNLGMLLDIKICSCYWDPPESFILLPSQC